MNICTKICLFFVSLNFFFNSISALEQIDRLEIEKIIQDYTDSWNNSNGRSFGDHFTEDADYITLSGKYFSGKDAIESRQISNLQTGFKDSKLSIINSQFREVYPGLVVGVIRWQLDGSRNPGDGWEQPGETREGINTQVFVRLDKEWKITASQTTLIPKKIN